MNGRQGFLDSLALGACAFILTQAVLSLILAPGDTPNEGNPVWKLILSVSYLAVALLLVPYYRETLYVVRRNWSLVALALLALVSFLWAETPALVLRRSIAVFGTTLFGIALAVRLSLEEQLRLMSWVFRIIAVLSLGCVLLLPGYGISHHADSHGAWVGVFDHKNGLGSVMGLAVLVEWQLPAYTRSDKIIKRVALLLSAVLLFLSDSITPTISLAGCFLLIEIYKVAKRQLRIPLYAIVLASVLIIACGVTAVLVYGEGLATAVGRSSDLTGRTQIWSMVLSYIPQRPLLGYGFSGFWSGASSDSATIDSAMSTMVMYSHNGYLEILLTLGAVGFLLSLIFLGTGIKRTYHFSEHTWSGLDFWPLAFLCYFLLHNLAECKILYQDLEWALCVALVVGTDVALLAPVAEQEEELLLTPTGELT